MAGGGKKKKKPAGNPARGFATTSVVSKSKHDPEASADNLGVDATQDGVNAEPNTVEHPIAGSNNVKDRTLAELTPDELQAQLEESEMRLFFEKFASKVRKEATRQVGRLQSERRILRGQAESVSVTAWLPEQLVDHILTLSRQQQPSTPPVATRSADSVDDETLANAWFLHQCLNGLAIPETIVADAVTRTGFRQSSMLSASLSHDIETCFEWLALFKCDDLPDYDVLSSRDEAWSDEENEKNDNVKTMKPVATSTTELDNSNHSQGGQAMTIDQDSVAQELSPALSGSESDDDPDIMMERYLELKTRVYKLEQRAPPLGSPSQGRPPTTVQKRLIARLDKIARDVLFDQRLAEVRWATMKVELARDAAQRRKLLLGNESLSPSEVMDNMKRPAPSTDVSEAAARLGEALIAKDDPDADDNMLEGLFDPLPDVTESVANDAEGFSSTTTIRDFGKITGISARRVFEEACRARDTAVRIEFAQISSTTYACRHEVKVHWSKTQERIGHGFLKGVNVAQKRRSTIVAMISIATPNSPQSESFVATIALFLIFSDSPKEERAFLRLPHSYRDLWHELVQEKEDDDYKKNASIVKSLRQSFELAKSGDAQEQHDWSEEVIFDARNRQADGKQDKSSSNGEIMDGLNNVGTDSTIELRNLWERKTASASYQCMLNTRQSLPMFKYRDEALSTIHDSQVTILCGETGCGKSTQLPAFLLEQELSSGRSCKIYCTQPRRISAISLAQRVSAELGEAKGDLGTSRSLVGYAIRLENKCSANTRLIYATVGIVLRMLEGGDDLREVTHLVIDEVHERSIDTDFLLIVLKSLLQRRSDLKVILMSATVDAQRFSSYLGGAPIISVPGRTFPVQAHFLEDAIEFTGYTSEPQSLSSDDTADREDSTTVVSGDSDHLAAYSFRTRQVLSNYDEYRMDYGLIVRLLEVVAVHDTYAAYSQAILVFLPGIAEIRHLNDTLTTHPTFATGWRIFPLHSAFSSDDQQAAFEIPPPSIRKIVLATNIAETGITIPDITCVVDTGKHKEMRFDEKRQMSRLIQSFVARANAKQRRGRAGRVQKGICFHLFTKHRHDQVFAEQQTPEMLRLSLQDLIMRVKICRLGSVETALSSALDPPPSKNVRRAIDALIDVGALSANEDLTSLGIQLSKLPVDAQLGKLLLVGKQYGCLDFALTIAAALSSKSPFVTPLHARKQADAARLGFGRGQSDLLTIYNAYTSWRKTCLSHDRGEAAFCNKNYLSMQNLRGIEDLKAQLLHTLIETGIVNINHDQRQSLVQSRHSGRHRSFISTPARLSHSDDNDDVISAVVAAAFYPKVLKRDGKGWRNIANNQTLALEPSSINKVNLPSGVRYLSFYSIMQSSSKFTNAQETTSANDYVLLLLVGEATFHHYAGVIVIDSNRLRFRVSSWRSLAAIMVLRSKIKEISTALNKSPSVELTGDLREWSGIVSSIIRKEIARQST